MSTSAPLQTNMIYFFFNLLPCEDLTYWLGYLAARFNVMNYNRMLQFEKIFKQYSASLKGLVCSNNCWKNAIFGSKIRSAMVKEYLLHLKIKKNQIPSIPIVIIELIGTFISIVPYK